jgi:protein-disulfide isomerase
MWSVSPRLGRGGYPIIAAVLLAAIAVGLTTIASGRLGTPRHDVEATLRGQLAEHPEKVRRFVKNYLLDNPRALQEALVQLLQRRAPSQADSTAGAESSAAAAFDAGKRAVLGNPRGDVTLVEFVDYNCGFCRRALGDLLDLVETDANLRDRGENARQAAPH